MMGAQSLSAVCQRNLKHIKASALVNPPVEQMSHPCNEKVRQEDTFSNRTGELLKKHEKHLGYELATLPPLLHLLHPWNAGVAGIISQQCSERNTETLAGLGVAAQNSPLEPFLVLQYPSLLPDP